MDGIVRKEDVLGGAPHVDGSRISVEQIQREVELLDRSTSEVARDFGLSLSAVYRALAYYHENEEVFIKMRKERDKVEAAKMESMITPPNGGSDVTTQQ